METFKQLYGPSVVGGSELFWEGPYGADRFTNNEDTIILNDYEDASTTPGSENLVLQAIDCSGTLVSSRIVASNFPVEATGNGFDYRQIGDNRYLLVWGQASSSDPQETSGEIVGEVVDAAGTVIDGPSVLVSNIPNLNDVLANARATIGQSYLVTYSTYDPQTSQEDINYIEYSEQGSELKSGSLYSAVQQNGIYNAYHIETLTPAALGDPEFLLAKQSDGQDGTNGYLQYQLLAADGRSVGSLQTIAPNVPDNAGTVAIDGQKLAGLSVSDASSYNLLAAYSLHYTADGVKKYVLDLHLLNTVDNTAKSVEIPVSGSTGVGFVSNTSDGGFVLTYSSGSSKVIQRYDNQGNATSDPYVLPNVTGKYALSVEPNGDVLVLYKTKSQSGQQIRSELVGTALPCYTTGTHILTVHGERKVEDLRVGDRVVTTGGRDRQVLWIGRRHLKSQRRAVETSLQPVCIHAGAFANNVPHRDLRVSPGHGVLIDDVLVPAVMLVNGATIVRDAVRAVTYWHVELDGHDILLAEGLPAESYLDSGNRSSFENADEPIFLHPIIDTPGPAQPCRPIAKAGSVVERAKRRLMRRAEALGFELTEGTDLHIEADGRRVAGRTVNGRVRFDIPGGADNLFLVSRAWVPAHVVPESQDDRSLGVCVSGLEIDGGPYDLASLAEGWHPLEGPVDEPCRWTRGRARLPAGSASVEFFASGLGRYWSPQHDRPSSGAPLIPRGLAITR